MASRYRYVRFFDEIGIADVALVGGKNASLGEMVRELTAQGVCVPNGFAVTTEAYRCTLDRAGAWPELRAVAGLDPADVEDLARRAAKAREIVLNAPLPSEVADEILAARARLAEQYGRELSVAVRSSATAEDLPTASFAGQHESYLNVRGEAELLKACRRCFASLFTDRAIRYRIDQGFDHFRVFLSVGVMKMVRSDLAASGVIFTLDTESGFRDVELIRLAVAGARRNRRHCGICGQAPSDYPEMAEFLVRLGIDSISVNPDTLIRTRSVVAEAEQSLRSAKEVIPVA